MIPTTSDMLPAEIEAKLIRLKDGRNLVFKGASGEEILLVETMVRNCAKNGDGFNLDEFCPSDGRFLHKFIFEPKVVIAIDTEGEIQGAAICGFSTLSRVPGSLYAAYFIVKETERRKGIASKLMQIITEICQKENCNTMLFDVYSNNHVAMEWLTKQGFLATGCIPHCGYLITKGFTQSFLLTKRINKLNSLDLISNL